jgi:hypothetical protein
MKLFTIERPSAMPAVLAQVTVSARAALPTAHVARVGRTAVQAVPGAVVQQLDNPMLLAASPADGAFAGKDIDRGEYAMGGVRGVPPRGRPV